MLLWSVQDFANHIPHTCRLAGWVQIVGGPSTWGIISHLFHLCNPRRDEIGTEL